MSTPSVSPWSERGPRQIKALLEKEQRGREREGGIPGVIFFSPFKYHLRIKKILGRYRCSSPGDVCAALAAQCSGDAFNQAETPAATSHCRCTSALAWAVVRAHNTDACERRQQHQSWWRYYLPSVRWGGNGQKEGKWVGGRMLEGGLWGNASGTAGES